MKGNNYNSICPTSLDSCKLLSKFGTLANNCILKSSLSVNGEFLAVGLSNYCIQVYDHENHLLCKLAHEKDISCIKFSRSDANSLLSSSLDGKLNVWDLRCQTSVQAYTDDTSGTLKPLTFFDYNLDETHICAGTELIREDAFLLFWDKRSSALLGGYWHSHNDDISEVHFNPEQNSVLASSSTDGLINVFDLNESSEEEALLYTLNVGSDIAKFSWQDQEQLSCITTLDEYQLWSFTEASPEFATARNKLSEHYEVQVDYLINSLQINSSWFLATGTNDGSVHLWESKKNSLNPKYMLPRGHSDVVRTISYDSKHGNIITGGEDGVVCIWALSS